MDRIRSYLGPKLSDRAHREYALLRDTDNAPVLEEPHRTAYSQLLDEDNGEDTGHHARFNWLEYLIFCLMGVAMLWAWNMFLAASPYFSIRLSSAPELQRSSQSAITSVSTVVSLTVMAVLLKMQYSANYPFRINVALLMNMGIFTVLVLSTFIWTDAPPTTYFAFLILEVAAWSWAMGLLQNGTFAFAASYGRPEYMQAIMTGQALAGVLPSITQMASVALAPSGRRTGGDSGDGTAPPSEADSGATSALIYFTAAVLVSALTLLAFQLLVIRHKRLVDARTADEGMAASFDNVEEAQRASRKVVGVLALCQKLKWLVIAVFGCFAVTMFFPVFTSRIVSVTTNMATPESDGVERVPSGASLSNPGFFIPLSFFFWNLGDLLGRMLSVLPALSFRHVHPVLILVAILRLGFLPLYALCNVDGRGAVVASDWFYLLLVQLPFGLTNGWLGSSCMMGAEEYVDECEREATGGFMGFVLVLGLTVGSLLSFSVAGT